MAGTMEGLGNKIWTDNEFKAFAGSENAKKYQNYKKQLEDDYDKNYSIGGNFLNWLGNGLSGGGWSKEDFLKNRGLTDENNSYGNAGYFGNTSLGELRNYGSSYNKNRLSQLDAGKGLFSGIPLIGELLSAPAQVVSAGRDLAESGVSKWQSGKRDWLSDLGALGETALSVVPAVGAMTKAGKAASVGAKTLGKTIGKGAAMGAGYGLAGGLNEMGAKNFDLGQLLTSTAVGAGVGGALSGAGYGLGKAWNKYSQPAPSKSTDLVKYGGGSASASPQLQEYMKTLGVTGDNLTEEGLKSARNQATKNLAKTVGYESTEGQAQRTAINNAYQELLKNLEGKGTSAAQTAQYVAPKTSFAQKLKNVGSNIPTMGRDIKSSKLGRATSKALSTRRGKIAAGAGAGLLLSQLLNNNSQNQPTQQELDELYNYIYGG